MSITLSKSWQLLTTDKTLRTTKEKSTFEAQQVAKERIEVFVNTMAQPYLPE